MKHVAIFFTAFLCVLTTGAPAADEPFRPEAGSFPLWKKRTPIGVNWCLWTMRTAEAASAWQGRVCFAGTIPNLLPCCPMAWSAITVHRRI